MSEEPLEYQSLLPYYLVLFVGTLLIALTGTGTADTVLLQVHASLVGWTITCALFVGVLAVFAAVVAWRMKQQAHLRDTHWEPHSREVGLGEFSSMVQQYAGQYAHLVSRLDPMLLLLCILMTALVVSVPPLMTMDLSLLPYASHTFGLLLIPLAILYSMFVFRLAPSEASRHFRWISPRGVRPMVELLASVPGVAWAGVEVELAESMGYYQIRQVRAVGRIEGIEGVARVMVDPAAPDVATAVLTVSEGTQHSRQVAGAGGRPPTVDALRGLIVWALQEYMEEKGRDMLLEEVLAEVTAGMEDSEANTAEERQDASPV